MSTFPTMPEGVHPILLGLTGSRLYGLDHADSDYDWKGVYQAPLRQVLSLGGARESYATKEPDFTIFELSKFVGMLLKANPTVLEMLWLSEYATLTEAGQTLVANRDLFLSNKVRTVYHGFGVGQLKLFRNGKGDAKAARHFVRVLDQGREVMATGQITPRCADPEAVLAYGEWAAAHGDMFLASAETMLTEFDELPSVLPDEVDEAAINELLFQLRMPAPPLVLKRTLT